jgi:hypothetical protein
VNGRDSPTRERQLSGQHFGIGSARFWAGNRQIGLPKAAVAFGEFPRGGSVMTHCPLLSVTRSPSLLAQVSRWEIKNRRIRVA